MTEALNFCRVVKAVEVYLTFHPRCGDCTHVVDETLTEVVAQQVQENDKSPMLVSPNEHNECGFCSSGASTRSN